MIGEVSKKEGFPITRRQTGLLGIFRLKNLKHDDAFAYLTFWDSIEALERFRAGSIVLATTKGEGLTVPRPNGSSSTFRTMRTALCCWARRP
jgi:heme-degrading monooxygenase HmoA